MAGKGKTAAALFLLVALTFVTFGNTLSGGFVSDDNFQIISNPWVTEPGHIIDMFTGGTGAFAGSHFQKSTYRPLMFVVFAIEKRLFGLVPFFWHLVNVILHALNGILLFFIALRLSGVFTVGRTESMRTFIALAAAGLFISHPAASETVSWISALPELFFTLLSLAAFYIHISTYRRRRTALAAGPVLFFMALLFKETAAVLPLLIFIYDRLRHRRSVGTYLAYAVAVVLYMAVRHFVLGGVAPASSVHAGLGGTDFLLTAMAGFARAMRMLFIPVGDRPFQLLSPVNSIFEVRAIVSLLFIAGLAASFVTLIKKANPVYTLSLSLIILFILPALYTPHVSRFDIAERYIYFSTAGYGLLLSGLFWRLSGTDDFSALRTSAVRTMTILLIVFCAMGAARKNAYWKDNLSLARAALEGSEENYFALFQTGEALSGMGRPAEARENYRHAIEILEKRKNPDRRILHDSAMGLASTYLREGRTKKALKGYLKVIARFPNSALAFYQAAYIYQSAGRCDRAVAFYQRAAALFRKSGDRRDALVNMGNCLAMTGLTEKARAAYNEALRISPGDAQVIKNLELLKTLGPSGRP